MTENNELNAKQRRFAEEYCVDFNATQAAIRAGYAETTARQQGSRLLSNADIQSFIAREQDRLSERTRVSQDRIVKELARTGFADMRNFAQWDGGSMRFADSEELTADDSPAVREVNSTRQLQFNRDGDLVGETVNTSIKLHDKKASLELLGRHLGMWKDNLNLSNDRPFVVRLKGISTAAEEAQTDDEKS